MLCDVAKLKRAMVAMKRLSTTADAERLELEQLAKEQRTVISRLRKDLSAAKTAPHSDRADREGISPFSIPWRAGATGD